MVALFLVLLVAEGVGELVDLEFVAAAPAHAELGLHAVTSFDGLAEFSIGEVVFENGGVVGGEAPVVGGADLLAVAEEGPPHRAFLVSPALVRPFHYEGEGFTVAVGDEFPFHYVVVAGLV